MKKLVASLAITLVAIFPLQAKGQAATGEKPTVLVWDSITDEGMGPVYQKILQSYIDSHPQVKVEHIWDTWTDAHTKILLMHQTNKMPDLIGVNLNWLLEFTSLDMLADLNPYLDRSPGMLEKFFRSEVGIVDGRVKILPYAGGNSALVYNAKTFRDTGLAVPDTLDQFVATGRKLTNASQNRYATQLAISEKNYTGANVCNIGPLLYTFGGAYIRNGKAAFNDERGVAAVQWMIDLEKTLGIAAPGSITVEAKNMREAFASERVFMTFDGAWGTPYYNDFPKLEAAIARMPKGQARGTVINIMCWGIAKASRNKDAAWDLLSYLLSDENLLTFYRDGNQMPSMPKYAAYAEFRSKYGGFLDTLADAEAAFFQTGSAPHEDDLYKMIVQAYQQAFLGKKSTRAALDEAAAAYDKLAAEYYASQNKR